MEIKEKKRGGCLSSFAKFVLLPILILVVISTIFDGSGSRGTSSPRPTEAPERVPGSVLEAKPYEDAVRYVAQYHLDKGETVTVTFDEENRNIVHVNMYVDSYSSAKSLLRRCGEYMYDVTCDLYGHYTGMEYVSVAVYADFVDKYGNTQKAAASAGVIDKELSEKINWSYWVSRSYLYPDDFIHLAKFSFIQDCLLE